MLDSADTVPFGGSSKSDLKWHYTRLCISQGYFARIDRQGNTIRIIFDRNQVEKLRILEISLEICPMMMTKKELNYEKEYGDVVRQDAKAELEQNINIVLTIVDA